jgi:hypothetical protein
MDKRDAVRIPVRVTARCRTSGVVIDGLVEDLSRSGVFLRSHATLAPGASAELDLDLPGEGTLRMEAKVVRVEARPREGVAFRFVEDAEPNRTLANFIMRQHAAG